MDNNKNRQESQPVFKSEPVEEEVPQENIQEEQSQNMKSNQTENVSPEMIPEEIPSSVSDPSQEKITESEAPTDVPPPIVEDNKIKYIIIISAVVFFFGILIVLFNLFFKGKPSTGPVTLKYWGLWEEKEVFDSLINDYQKNNPNIKIEYTKVEVQDYREKLLARGEKGMGPDIFRYHNTWLPEIKKITAPLPSKIMSNEQFEKTFYPIHVKDLKVGNNYYGLPLEVDGLVLIYNESLFKQAGISKVPTTWDDITNAVFKITVKDTSGQLINSGIALGTASNISHFSDILGLMFIQNGITDIRDINKPDAASALEVYRKFAESPDNVWSEDMPNSITAFIQGKVAMILAPSWEILVINENNPEIDMKVVPVPQVPGAEPVSISNYWVEGVSRYSKNQMEAWKFLRYLTEKENMTKLYENQSKTRLFGEPYSRVDLADVIIQNEYIGAVIKQAADDYYYSMPVISRTYDNGLNDSIVTYLENAVNATINGESYQSALENAKEGVDQIFQMFEE